MQNSAISTSSTLNPRAIFSKEILQKILLVAIAAFGAAAVYKFLQKIIKSTMAGIRSSLHGGVDGKELPVITQSSLDASLLSSGQDTPNNTFISQIEEEQSAEKQDKIISAEEAEEASQNLASPKGSVDETPSQSSEEEQINVEEVLIADIEVKGHGRQLSQEQFEQHIKEEGQPFTPLHDQSELASVADEGIEGVQRLFETPTKKEKLKNSND